VYIPKRKPGVILIKISYDFGIILFVRLRRSLSPYKECLFLRFSAIFQNNMESLTLTGPQMWSLNRLVSGRKRVLSLRKETIHLLLSVSLDKKKLNSNIQDFMHFKGFQFQIVRRRASSYPSRVIIKWWVTLTSYLQWLSGWHDMIARSVETPGSKSYQRWSVICMLLLLASFCYHRWSKPLLPTWLQIRTEVDCELRPQQFYLEINHPGGITQPLREVNN